MNGKRAEDCKVPLPLALDKLFHIRREALWALYFGWESIPSGELLNKFNAAERLRDNKRNP